jgi:hypothetical protein
MTTANSPAETTVDEHKKKRRRRKRRSAKGLPGEGAGEESHAGEAVEASAMTTAAETLVVDVKTGPDGGMFQEDHKKKRRRRKRASEKPAPADGAAEGTVPEQPRSEPDRGLAIALPEQLNAATAPAKKLPRATRKKAVMAAPAETLLPVLLAEHPPAAVVEPKPKGDRRGVAQKAVETQLHEVAVVIPEKKVRSRKAAVPKLTEVASAAAEEGSPVPALQRKRSVRSKKEKPANEPSGE